MSPAHGPRAEGAARREQEFSGAWLAHLSNDRYDRAAVLVAGLAPGEAARMASEYGVTPLHMASSHGSVRFCELILQAGADPNARDHFGRVPLAIFGLHCREEFINKPPSAEERTRFARLMRAAGARTRGLPRRHVVLWAGGVRPADLRAPQQLEAFWRACELQQTAPTRALPYPHEDDEDPRRGYVWLTAREVGPVRERLTGLARETGLGGLVTLDEWRG